MKIIGGHFGTTGRAWIQEDQFLKVEGAKSETVHGKHIEMLDTRIERERQFGCFVFVILALLLTLIGFFFIGLLGALIGFVLAIALSFNNKRRQIAELRLDGDRRLELECTTKEIRQLMDVASWQR